MARPLHTDLKTALEIAIKAGRWTGAISEKTWFGGISLSN
jgi:hypothetical protein